MGDDNEAAVRESSVLARHCLLFAGDGLLSVDGQFGR
ncbi:hypothetical protein CABS01_17042 [Colletotrichum abscissum]|nr:uncharacterized protein CABS01_17042 [Colletotrichum abscissum]KAK1497395.1 hypothetical protein CABS01_17042 [Colletotrichum abscissum]